MAKVGRFVKESILQELSVRLAEHPNLFVATLGGLPASEADRLRQQLFASKAELVMVKRRIGRRAVDGLKVPGLADLLEGSIGLVLPGGDVLPTAKLLVEFIKAHEQQAAVRGAVIDGQLLDTKRVEQLASLPPKPILLAQLVATIESPIADVIFTIERLVGDIAWIAEQAAAAKPAQPIKPADAAPKAAAPAQPVPETPAAPGAQDTGSKPGEGTPA